MNFHRLSKDVHQRVKALSHSYIVYYLTFLYFTFENGNFRYYTHLTLFPNKFGYSGNVCDLSVGPRGTASSVNTINRLASLRIIFLVKSMEILTKSQNMLETSSKIWREQLLTQKFDQILQMSISNGCHFRTPRMILHWYGWCVFFSDINFIVFKSKAKP